MYTILLSASAVIALFLQYKYPILAALAFLEGPYIMMLSGVLIKLGMFALIPTYIALSIGDLLDDILWYFIGYHFGNRFVRRFGKFFDIDEKKIESAKELFIQHRKKILLGSKVTAGFGLSLATLFTAGLVKTPFGEYLTINFFGQFIWTGIMLAVGYFFGNLYLVVDNVLGKVFIIVLALLVLYLLLRLGRRLGRQARKDLANKN